MMRRALTIGVDGASWDIIHRLKYTEVLSMKFIESNTAYATLKSTMPPWSIPAWNSLFSGLSPEGLGIYGFLKPSGDKLVPLTRELDGQVYLWDLVSMRRGRVIAVNIPCVSQAIPVNGYFVAGFLADRSNIAWPPSLNRILHKWGYIVDVTDVNPLTDEEYLEACIKMTIQRTSLFLELARRTPWTLGILVYTCSDRIQHRFLKSRFSFVEKYYEVLDACIAKLLDTIDMSDTIVFMVSDHGFKVPRTAFNINRYLASKGYLEYPKLPLRTSISGFLNYELSNSLILLTAMRKIMRKAGRFKLSRRIFEEMRNASRNHRNRSIATGIPKGAYMPSEDGVVYVNVPREVKSFFIKRVIEDIRHVPGIRAYNVHGLFEQDVENAPDIILESDLFAFHTDPMLPIKLRTMRATHSRNGILAAFGADIINKRYKGMIPIHSVTPTVLCALGNTIPPYMDSEIAPIFLEEKIKCVREEVKGVQPSSLYNKYKLAVRIRRLMLNHKG